MTDEKRCEMCGSLPFAEYSVRVYTGINSDEHPTEAERLGESMETMQAEVAAIVSRFESELQVRWAGLHMQIVLM